MCLHQTWSLDNWLTVSKSAPPVEELDGGAPDDESRSCGNCRIRVSLACSGANNGLSNTSLSGTGPQVALKLMYVGLEPNLCRRTSGEDPEQQEVCGRTDQHNWRWHNNGVSTLLYSPMCERMKCVDRNSRASGHTIASTARRFKRS